MLFGYNNLALMTLAAISALTSLSTMALPMDGFPAIHGRCSAGKQGPLCVGNFKGDLTSWFTCSGVDAQPDIHYCPDTWFCNQAVLDANPWSQNPCNLKHLTDEEIRKQREREQA
ncbi:hypothetical protein H4219_005015 [Mycoemilia scoparia]|uniref:Uncharacterized protein n=1 Tax=Mycoemilia scoparia TaxID=417184 RepID=A0A9W7ZQL2_9FUNG|nr:hypothetical protein H4219_005015 [Mycoemilia scoparia]